MLMRQICIILLRQCRIIEIKSYLCQKFINRMTIELNKNKIEVFKTDVGNNIQVQHLQKKLEKRFPKLEISFDLSETDLPYPCGHTILRVEGQEMFSDKIISTIIKSGFKCDVLEDKVCQ